MNTSAPTRRLILGTFAALPLAGLPAVLPVAGASGPNPDAALIAACAVHDDCQLELERAYEESGDEDVGDEVTAPIYARKTLVIDRIDALRATSLEGVVARARTLAIYNGHGTFDMDPGNRAPAGRMVKALMRDALSISGLPIPAVLERAADEMAGVKVLRDLPQITAPAMVPVAVEPVSPQDFAEACMRMFGSCWKVTQDAAAKAGNVITYDDLRAIGIAIPADVVGVVA